MISHPQQTFASVPSSEIIKRERGNLMTPSLYSSSPINPLGGEEIKHPTHMDKKTSKQPPPQTNKNQSHPLHNNTKKQQPTNQ